MRGRVFAALLCSGIQVSCVFAPPLSEATGTAHSDIFIRDVVQRIKCELSEAFDDKVDQPDFLWLASWTAHVDLTLTINDNAGISPSGSYTHYQQNAVNQAAGPSAFPPTAARAVVNQFLTVSAGATLSGQAVRTETVSFTVALDELKRWRRALDKVESVPGFPQEKRICDFGVAAGITGNLGLKEWVDSAFSPVSDELQAGIHSSQTAKAPSPSVPAPGAVGPKAAFEKLTVKEALDNIIGWQGNLAVLAATTKQLSTKIDDGRTSIPNARASIKQKIDAARQYRYVLVRYLAARYARVSYLIGQYSNDLLTCETTQSLLQKEMASANLEATRLYDSLKDITNPNEFISSITQSGFNLAAFTADYNALTGQMRNFESDGHGNFTTIDKGQYATEMSKCAKVVDEATALPGRLPQQVDPPIDSVLHSLTFVINYGANVTPSWTLIQWKGPGQSPNFASAAGVRTHNLVISLGPRAGGPAIGDDPLRLIQLQAIRSINQQ